VVTGANLFARSIGSAVGVAIFGAIANAIFAGSPAGEDAPATVEAASASVFLAVAITAVAVVGAALAMPRRRHADRTVPDAAAEPAAG
jgi:hypothetical protein